MQPTIKILFTGLLNFYYDAVNKKFEIGALKDDAHCLTIGISKIVSGQVAERKVLTYVTDPDEPDQVEIIDGPGVSINVFRTNRGAVPFPDGDLNIPSKEFKDFRDIVCIDGMKFHNSPTTMLPHVTGKFPKIVSIDDGSFYSELRIPLIKERAINPTSHPTEILDVTWYAGADISLATGEHALLTYQKDGKPEQYRMDSAVNTNYVIFIENGCHDEIRPRSEYTDFDIYYKVFNINPAQQYRLKVPEDAKYDVDENLLVLNYPIVWYTRKVVWGSYSSLNFGNNSLWLELPDGSGKREFRITVDNLCIPGRTLNKYW